METAPESRHFVFLLIDGSLNTNIGMSMSAVWNADRMRTFSRHLERVFPAPYTPPRP